ncbi:MULTISPECIES: hypothetical protein [Burkholderia]|uniref:Uncharacterized protein n=1 Tax=Burkholderia mayonis TaxID=1385591 RepID=A0A1B4FE70_9BURK|nr:MULTISPECIES: hypothetical protein [Burkholderia]AOJ01852.1 hypothetical protein WS70_08410 [Burkholderia mayonis]KVE43115.1 hypothetical protein WS69_23905 [Burkholderia sp. BDU5]KVE47288.1 hypothetical protein WS70_26010 [Burkholderia mayonis]
MSVLALHALGDANDRFTSEVRSLAPRSSSAAKEIKDLMHAAPTFGKPAPAMAVAAATEDWQTF